MRGSAPDPEVFRGMAAGCPMDPRVQKEAPDDVDRQGPLGHHRAPVGLAIPRQVAPPQSLPPFRQIRLLSVGLGRRLDDDRNRFGTFGPPARQALEAVDDLEAVLVPHDADR